MLIPPFTPDGGLPVGTFKVTFEELRSSHLVTGPGSSASGGWDAGWRTRLVDNAEILTRQLWQCGIANVFLDGSFAEAKSRPNDIDGYFECDPKLIASGDLQRQLNAIDPYEGMDVGTRLA